ncbi:isoleucine--tRNA ligase [Oxobacter pfennigii]|uniref:Isoleucine--tRNA ligase n=1 Tax=Oxobacter pfennigii TaxID=36849 RepID=A0A0P8WTH3_9CLOT|nr:isoleucine--tRNA ligase [Oxobacter pfennigii]KPU45941.1 isoleucine--tRNA ligase [Oxobacter pfennigii]
MYKKVSSSLNFINMEEEILKYWEENQIFKKSREQEGNGEYFTFYDGPPTANGKPHIGHVLTRVIKDLIPRYKVMKGYKVLRKAGWDTHGLPVELEVEKQLGISGKPQIEEYGVEDFIKKCKDSVFTYASEWKDMSDRVGFWVDMDDPYVTYHDNYIESEWWALKQIWDKGLLYKGHKVVPYCPRCGTALSSHEVAQGYKDVLDSSIYVKFRVKGQAETYFLVWTTTPWTLPSNVALAVNKNENYVKAEYMGQTLILAEARLSLLGEEGKVLETFKGDKLLGIEYEPLFDFAKPDKKAYYVVAGDFVTLSDGSGIVHMAPAFGEDDYNVGKQNDLPFIQLVDTQGKFKEEVTPWKGQFVKDADKSITNDLDNRGLLFKEEKHEHSYPFCWRCDTPLLYYARDTWFVRTTAIKENLLRNNDTINWLPDNIKKGRFGNFLENVIDWGISRERYWGTPLNIWTCGCGHKECIGSKQELKEKGINVPENIELHKPYIDEVKLKCPQCGGEMTRVTEVIDCWFDSGSMPFAQWHYPFENKEKFENMFPAQFISEAVDQTRGWFYTLHVISTLLFDKAAFENCIVLGHVQDKNGQKMSKHKGNVLDPWTVLNKEGADATRWYFFAGSAPWLPSRFYEDAVIEYQRKFMGTLWNVYAFYVLYAEIDSFNPYDYKFKPSENIMDKWIISKLNSVIKTVDNYLNNYRITEAARALSEFVDELSNWYVRRNRARFWQSEMTDDKVAAYMTLYNILDKFIKLAAPFVPFITEEIYQNIVRSTDKNAPESIHLCKYPEFDESLIDTELENDMDVAYKIVQLGRAARNDANIKNRQPLSRMIINFKNAKLPEYYIGIVNDELNIKDVQFSDSIDEYVEYGFKINFPVLGPKFGKLVPKIGEALKSASPLEASKKFKSEGELKITVSGEDVTLTTDDVEVVMKGKEGYAFQTNGHISVVLDKALTEELINEGYIREIISKIQNMRKDSGFEVSDRIEFHYYGNEKLKVVIESNADFIMAETLSDKVAEENKTELKYTEWNINGEKLNMSVSKI